MKSSAPILAILIALFAPLADAADAPVLDVSKESVEKFSTSASMIGTRDTLMFYTFKDQQAVLRVNIDNNSTKFPITATLYMFADDVTAEGLAKWVNNQHSDGLFGDAPEPVGSHEVPADMCSVVSHKLIDRTKHHNGEHDNYEVKFQIGEFAKEGVFKLKDFTTETKVHIKVVE
jgi:hypothetical protein